MKLNLKQLRVGILIAALMLASGFWGYKLGHGSKAAVKEVSDRSQVDLSLMWRVWDMLDEKYLVKEDIKPQQMIWGAIRGMTASLNDPYTAFLPPQENKETKEELNGAFEGVGIQLGYKDDILSVVAPLSGMPAEAAGIKAGDYILHIKDEKKGIDVDTTDMSLPEAVEIIRGEEGTSVVLTIMHQGESQPREIAITRGTIVIKSVELEWLGEDKTVAEIRLTRFGGRTEAEWEEAVDEIVKKSDLKGIILDLRNNPGGYLQGAVRYAGEFLEKNQVVVKQVDGQGKIETYSVTDKGKLLTVPLVVLVNQGSASSSEILAGSLKDHQRAKLVGEKTFGKGTIQEALDLGEGAGLHVTTAKWLLPSGQWVNESQGIEPDVTVSLDDEQEGDEQLEKAMEVLLNK